MDQKRKEHIANCKKKFMEFYAKRKILIRYVRNKDYAPIGLVMAWIDDDGRIIVSFSKRHKHDEYNRYMGLVAAIEAAKDSKCRTIPSKMMAAYRDLEFFAHSPSGVEILSRK